MKSFWRFIRCWVTHNHKLYYSYVIFCAFGIYTFWSKTLISFYRNRNYEVSSPLSQVDTANDRSRGFGVFLAPVPALVTGSP